MARRSARAGLALLLLALLLLLWVGPVRAARWHAGRRYRYPARRYSGRLFSGFRHRFRYRSRGERFSFRSRRRRGYSRRKRGGFVHRSRIMQQQKHLPAQVLDAAARQYRIDPALLSALMQVESGGRGFLPNGKVLILFERHVFWRQLRARGIDAGPIARSLPGLCGTRWDPRGHPYGSSESQYSRLALIDAWASRHDPARRASYMKAAWESCSYGLFQIMGFNYRAAGYPEITSFQDAMEQSEEVQLGIILHWMEATGRLDLLRQRRFREFVTRYNGGGQVGRYEGQFMGQYRAAAGFWFAYEREKLHRTMHSVKARLTARQHSPKAAERAG